MFKKYLILIGRTFIATFLLVNFFNIIPLNFSSNAWYVQVSMLLVDTSSLLLLGLSSLKLVSYLSINKEDELEQINLDQNKNQKYKNNIKVINKFSLYSMYLFIFVAFLQLFVVINGLSQLDLLYSERVIRLENQYQIIQKQKESEINLKDINKPVDENLDQKDRIFENLTNQKNTAISYLVRDAIKVFLMSLIWVFGFFKLSKFS